MSQKVASKRSLDNFKEDNDDVASIDQIAKKNKVGGKKSKCLSGSNENSSNDNSGNDKNENKEKQKNNDVAFDVNEILEDVYQVTSEKNVTGLKELKALKNGNLPYIDECAIYHVVPQFPQTREKDKEIEIHLIDPNYVEPGGYQVTDEDRGILLPFMLDKSGAAVRSNIDWEKAEPVMMAAHVEVQGDAAMKAAKLLEYVEGIYTDAEYNNNDDDDDDDDDDDERDPHANSVEGFNCDTFEEFAVAFENLLTQSKSFLEQNSNEAVRIYVQVIGDKKTHFYLINFFPN